jgi:hypothetical protein
MAKDVLELLEHVGWTDLKQLHVVGVSMGGMYIPSLTTVLCREMIGHIGHDHTYLHGLGSRDDCPGTVSRTNVHLPPPAGLK